MNRVIKRTNNNKKRNNNYRYFLNLNNQFVVINFADIQIQEKSQLEESSLIYKIIKQAIENEHPDIIIFNGDVCWLSNVLFCYKLLCNVMDKFKIPYYIVLGNHDREFASGEDIYKIINNSKYGHLKKGPNNLDSFGNYRIDIINRLNNIVHSLILMDSRDRREYLEQDYQYVIKLAPNMLYDYRNEKPFYGSHSYDGVRDNQIKWYKKQISIIKDAKSTIIMHIPTVEFAKAAHNYYLEKSEGKNVDKYSASGTIEEPISSPPISFGLYEAVRDLGSTKLILVGHDHVNDLSLIYNEKDNVRLAYAIKSGDGCYWKNDGSKSGYSKITIDKNGIASLTQHYLKF